MRQILAGPLVIGIVLLSSSPRLTGQAPPAAHQPGPLQAELTAQLVRTLEKIASGVDGVVGYVVTDLTTQTRVAARLEREPMPTASAIKLSVLYELMKQVEAGTLTLDVPSPVNRAQLVGGSGVLQFLGTPSLSLRDHATLMIMVSDNSSTNIVITAVGMDKVNARMTSLGIGDIRLRRLMMDAAAVKRGDENVASPQSLARIAELLAGEREAAADLSHRLRTPVTALRLDTDLVADDAVRDRLRSHVEDLHRVIDSVVTEARRTSRDDMTAAGDLASVAAGRTAYWRPLAEDQDRSLAVEVPSTPVFVALPSADLRDLVDTLIDNVFAHTPEGTDLEVTVTATDGVARLAVADAGPGLASVDLVERGRSGNGGTGLGLDIVQRLADRAGGSVRLGRAHLGGLLVEVQLPHLPSAD